MEQWASVPIAVGLAGLTQAVKQALDERYHRYVPLGLTFVGPAVGAGISLVMGGTWQDGVIQGIVGSAGAVFGYEWVKGLIGERA
jgi:uncharacterized membrane protein YjjP (DUF1212 family)